MTTYTLRFSGTMTVRAETESEALHQARFGSLDRARLEIIGRSQEPQPVRAMEPRVICSWCESEKPVPMEALTPNVSHGICAQHQAEQLAMLGLTPQPAA